MSDTFCILPWIHIYVNPDGSVLPCCIADYHKHLGNTRNSSLENIWNSEKYKTLRKNMLQGKKCEECSACYKNEDIGLNSFRQSSNKKYEEFIPLADKTNDDGSLDELSLRYFDVRWSNICNFKCRSCSSTYSSSWAKEDKENGIDKSILIYAGGKDNDSLYRQFQPHFKNIKEFYFAGGEPLLTDKHYDILEHLVEVGNTDIKLRYNTNLSVLGYKDKSVLDLWQHFPDIDVDVSIDSWKERAEYIREGTIWNDIENNFKLIRKELPNVNLQTNTVVSVFNIFTLGDFLNYLDENNIIDKKRYYPSFYNLINPTYYSVDIIPDRLKQKIILELKRIDFSSNVNDKISSIIHFLGKSKYNADLHKQFIIKTQYYDNIRNRQFNNYFPELDELYENVF